MKQLISNIEISVILSNEKIQRAFGAKFGKLCHQKNCVIYLQGDLGAGKTTLAKGFLQGLGYVGKVKSPTYTLVETYNFADEQVLHVDLYRINSPAEIFNLGIYEKPPNKTQIHLIEWPEKALKELPKPDITCNITPVDNKRRAILRAYTLNGNEIISVMKKIRGYQITCNTAHEGKSF